MSFSLFLGNTGPICGHQIIFDKCDGVWDYNKPTYMMDRCLNAL